MLLGHKSCPGQPQQTRVAPLKVKSEPGFTKDRPALPSTHARDTIQKAKEEHLAADGGTSEEFRTNLKM